jgi:hypothetical protein
LQFAARFDDFFGGKRVLERKHQRVVFGDNLNDFPGRIVLFSRPLGQPVTEFLLLPDRCESDTRTLAIIFITCFFQSTGKC